MLKYKITMRLSHCRESVSKPLFVSKLWVSHYSWKYSFPLYGRPRGIFVMIARAFQIILKLGDTRFYEGRYLYWNLIEVYKIKFRNSIV